VILRAVLFALLLCGGASPAGALFFSHPGGGSAGSAPLLPADRNASANWQMAGLASIGGIPTRSTVCATVSPIGGGSDDTADIQAAINGCPAGEVVSLAAGTFTVLGSGYVWLDKGITVRGAGPGTTIIESPTGNPAPGTGTFTCPAPSTYGTTWDCPGGGGNGPVFLASPVAQNVTNTTTACALTADGIQGAFTINVTHSCISNFSVGQQVVLDEADGTQWMPDALSPNTTNAYTVVAAVPLVPSASGTWSYVNSVVAQGTNATSTTTAQVNMTGVNREVACVADYDGDGATLSTAFSDSTSATWTEVASYDGGSPGRLTIYSAPVTGTSTQTFTFAASTGAYASIAVVGYTGSTGVGTVGTPEGNIAGSAGSSNTVSVSSASGNALVSCLSNNTPLSAEAVTPGSVLQNQVYSSGYGYGISLGSYIGAATSSAWSWGGGYAIWASPDYGLVYDIHWPTQFDDCVATGSPPAPPSNCYAFNDYTINPQRARNEIKQVASVNATANTVTFDSPLMLTYRASQSADLWYFTTPFLQQAGVENLSILYGANAVQFQNCAYCWAYKVEVAYSIGQGQLYFGASFRDLLEHFYVHEGTWPEPGGAGYNIALRYDTSEVLIDDGISTIDNKVMVMQDSGQGSVVAYNYMDDGEIYDNSMWQEVGINASHLAGSHHVLFEGNQTFNMDSDDTHGAANYLTFFRNWSKGIRTPFAGHWDTYACGYTLGPTLTITSLVASGLGTSGYGAVGNLGKPADTPQGLPPAPNLGVVQGATACAGTASSPLISGTAITADGTGTGDVGTYTINHSQTVGSSGAPVEFLGFGYNTYEDVTPIACAQVGSAGPMRAAATMAHSYWQSYVGNVLGVAGCTTTANGWSLSASTYASPEIYWLGWYTVGPNYIDPIDQEIYPGTPPTIACASGVTATCAVPTASCTTYGSNCSTVVTGNWDAINAAQEWDARGALVLPNSLYLSAAPSWWPGGDTWPWVNPATGTLYTLPAKARFDAAGCATATFQSGTDCEPF
jgi:hypothetical protein